MLLNKYDQIVSREENVICKTSFQLMLNTIPIWYTKQMEITSTINKRVK